MGLRPVVQGFLLVLPLPPAGMPQSVFLQETAPGNIQEDQRCQLDSQAWAPGFDPGRWDSCFSCETQIEFWAPDSSPGPFLAVRHVRE